MTVLFMWKELCDIYNNGPLVFSWKVEGLVIADIDLGEVTPCTTLTIPSMPQGAVTTFEVMYKRLQGHFDVVNLERWEDQYLICNF